MKVRVVEVKNPDEKEFHKKLGIQIVTIRMQKYTPAHAAISHLGINLLLQDIGNYILEIIVFTVSHASKDLWTSDV